MSTVRFKIDYRALGLACNPAITSLTERIAQTAGEGFVGDVRPSKGKGRRPHGAVRATTYKSRARNARDNTLLKAALSAGG